MIAVAHSFLVIAYHLLTRQTTYTELGRDYLDHLGIARAARVTCAALSASAIA